MLTEKTPKVRAEPLPEELLTPPSGGELSTETEQSLPPPPDDLDEPAAPQLPPPPIDDGWEPLQVEPEKAPSRAPWVVAVAASVVALLGVGLIAFGLLRGGGGTFTATIDGLGALEVTGSQEVPSWEVGLGQRVFPGSSSDTFVVVQASLTDGQWDDADEVMAWARDAAVSNGDGVAIDGQHEAFFISVKSVPDQPEARDVEWVFRVPKEAVTGLDLDLGDGIVVGLDSLPNVEG